MKYTKPVVFAQNKKSGSYAAGCPAEGCHINHICRKCERTM